jgi:hypothetical protein
MSESDNVEELRRGKRFVIDPPLRGSFANTDITIDNLGERGLRAEHAGPIKLGITSRLSIIMPTTQEVVRIEARVAWSRLSRKPDANGKFLYRSGLRIDGDPEIMKAVLTRVIHVCMARPDTASLERKRQALAERARSRAAATTLRPIATREAEIPSDQVLLIRQARARLLARPDEAVKWYNRAKYSQTQTWEAGQHHRDETVAIWEYLERTIDIAVISRVLEHPK